jgi:HEAT repeat protein
MKRSLDVFPCLGVRLAFLAALVAALPALTGCPKSDDPAYYIKRLESSDAEVQRRAIEELVRMSKEAMPGIKEALKSENPNVRKGCADFLSKVRRMESLTDVGTLISDPDKTVRLKVIEAVAGLSQVWKVKSVELLAIAFDGDDAECVKKAGEGLRDMKFAEATAALRARFEAGKGIQAIYAAKLLFETEPSPETARPLLQGLISDEPTIRDAAKANVKELKDTIVPYLVTFVDTGEGVARAGMVLDEVRQGLIDELKVILDSARAGDILGALGTIADDQGIEKLNADLRDTKLESAWRVAAARSLAIAALSRRSSPEQKAKIKGYLSSMLDDEDQDKRIRIGAAIALCQLGEERAVAYLLEELDLFEEAIKAKSISQARLDDMTALRIRAQEALTASGDFVVPFLMARLRDTRKEPGPIIIWAAAKTLGELNVHEVVPFLGTYLTATKTPQVVVNADGSLRGEVPAGEWQSLTDEQAAELGAKFEAFKCPDFVRWASAVALGQIGGAQAVSLLRQAETAETAFVGPLLRLREGKDYYKQANVLDGLIGQHEDVLFYIRKALGSLGQKA